MHPTGMPSLAQKFIMFITKDKGEFEGTPEFSDKVKEMINHASELKVGRTFLEQLLNLEKPVSIIEGKNEDLFGGNIFNPSASSISFNFKKFFYLGINRDGEREIIESPIVCRLIHEGTHFKHFASDVQSAMKRLGTPSAISDMHNQEEEITITGIVTGSDEKELCNENAVLLELGLPPRINHDGYYQESPSDSFKEMIVSRATATIRKKFASIEGQKEAAALGDILLPFVMEIMHKCETSSELLEYSAITHLFIQQGCKSDAALASSLESGRPEFLEIARQLLQAGCKSDQALVHAINLMGKAKDLKSRNEYLQIILQLLRAGCKSNAALENAVKEASCESDLSRQIEWITIIYHLLEAGCNSPQILENIVGIILRSSNKVMQKRWAMLIKPLIDQALDSYICKMEQQFCYNIEQLIVADYSPFAFELFQINNQYLVDKDRALLDLSLRKMQDQITIIHHFTEKKEGLADILKSLKAMSDSRPIIQRILFLDSLINGTNYIAVCGKKFVQSQAGEYLLPQFEQMRNACTSIMNVHKERKNWDLFENLCIIKIRHLDS